MSSIILIDGISNVYQKKISFDKIFKLDENKKFMPVKILLFMPSKNWDS